MPVTVAVAVAAEGSGPTVPLTAQGNGSSSINKPHYAEPTVAEGLHADNSGLLFKKVTPRRRKDQFGRESTRHADYLLSMAVFPTGVRAPLLSELQKKSEHQWGFEIFDKGTKPASPVSHVHIRDSKSAPDSSCCRQGSAAESAKKPPPNTPLKGSLKLTSDRGAFHHQSQSFSCSSPTRAKCRWVHSITEAAGPTGVGLGGQKKVKDIRDPLYINTYCQGERKLRYKKSTLPLSTRARPWTVSEPNPSYRFKRQSKEVPSSEKPRGRPGRPEWADQGLDFRINARDVMARTKGSTAGGAQDDEDPEESEVTASMKGNQALMMVKSYFPGTGGDITLGDQREKLRGKQGCLHAKVKQCIKFVMFRHRPV